VRGAAAFLGLPAPTNNFQFLRANLAAEGRYAPDFVAVQQFAGKWAAAGKGQLYVVVG
jgi:hypothetical protein